MNVLRSHKLFGLVFIALVLFGIWFTYGIFNKSFVDYDRVSLQSSKLGLQLPARADVKIRGVIVGEVLDTKATRDGAVLTLGLFPDHTESIPRNVTARIEPKTLFGEKYVALQVPGSPSSESIRAGETISQTIVSHEVEATLNDVYPLLRAVAPADLNVTLNALATALEGRGDRIGGNLEILDAYLKRINPQLPDIVEDLKLLSSTSDLYADVLPEIAETLRNSVVTGETLVSREAKLRQLFLDVSAFSDTASVFLEENGENLVRLNEVSAEQLRVLAKYSPEFPCLTAGLVNAGVKQAEAFRGFVLHINLELLPHQPRAYGPADDPRYGDKGGPDCLELPDPPHNTYNAIDQNIRNVDDGVDEPTGKGSMRAPFAQSSSWFLGSPAEDSLLRELLGATSGTHPEDVDDLNVLLFAPMMRGAEVTLR